MENLLTNNEARETLKSRLQEFFRKEGYPYVDVEFEFLGAGNGDSGIVPSELIVVTVRAENRVP